MKRVIAIALLATVVAVTLLMIAGTQTDPGNDRAIQVAGCINGVCS